MVKDNLTKTVLITGASSGIGYEFAKIFAINNYNLILIGRNIQKLEIVKKDLASIHSINITLLQKDLADINEVHSIINYLIKNNVLIDVLINNAGVGVYGEFTETDHKIETDMINLNILALTNLTKFVLKDMLKNNSGSIINVASTAAFKPGPLMAVYYATKAYVLSFSESVAAEIRDTNVTLTVLCPGPTKTDFMKKSSDRLIDDLKFKKMQTPSEVALYGYNAMLRKELIAIPGLTNRVFTLLFKFIPRILFANLMYKMKQKT